MTAKPDFESLVERHSGELFSYLWRLLGSEADASDCLQETFLRAFRAYEWVRDFSNLRAWLYKIATNAARTHLSRDHRRQSRSEPLLEPVASGEKAVDLQVAERTQLAAVKQAVMALPERQRAALMMRKYQELEYAEIAAALNCSEDAARANVYQALKKLRELFANEVNDE
ncbi:MAG: RNA polymerase sigma factor [Anaerolineales bacterium]